MVQKSEELQETGTAPYSDASCAVRLRPLQLLAHTYCTLRISSLLQIWSIGWAYFRPFAITFSENGGWAYFWGGRIFKRLQYRNYYRQYSTL